MTIAKQLFWSFSLLILPLMLSCEGDAGLPGEDLMGSDHIAPVVEIILPTAHRTIYDQSTLEAHVQDDGAIASVEFLIDGETFVNQDLRLRTPPYQTIWDCRSITLGQHFIQAIAYDSSGRSGYSPRVLIYKLSSDSLPADDSISYFNRAILDQDLFPTNDALFWRLPGETERFTGFGTRFTLDRPGRLTKFWISLQFRGDPRGNEIWIGTQLLIEISSSDNGLPSDVLDSRVFDFTNLREIPPNRWIPFNLPAGARRAKWIDVPTEFIITIALSPEATGDTLSIVTDRGARRNWHGLVREYEQWRTFDAGPRVAFNPLIWVKVEYPEDEG